MIDHNNNDNINLVGNFNAQGVEINFQETLTFICMQKINFIFNFFFEILYCKLAILGTLGILDQSLKIILSNCSKLSCLSVCKKSTSSFNSLRYRKEIANLLFSVNWACLATHTYNDDSNLKKPFTFICRQKIKFILHVFLERYCKLIVLGTLDMSDQANPK